MAKKRDDGDSVPLTRVPPGPPVPELVRNPAGAPQHPLATTPAGPALSALIAAADPGALANAALVDLVAACERQQAALEAVKFAAMAEVGRRCSALPGVGLGSEQVPVEAVVAAELAPVLHVSRVSAEDQFGLARQLMRLPVTRAALASGALTAGKARAIAESCVGLSDEQCAALEARLFPRALSQNVPLLRSGLRRALLAIDPQRARERRQAALKDRGVWRRSLGDGLAELVFVGGEADVEAYYHAITEQARVAQQADRDAAAGAADADSETATGPAPVRVRTLDECRADVLGDLGRAWLAGGPCCLCGAQPTGRGRRTQVNVVVAASTLLGLDDEPGELIGLGPISAEVARELAADAEWRRFLVEPGSRRLLDMTTKAHDPPPSMRKYVQARDGTCRAPGCRQPASQCDLDHSVEHPRGDTCPGNLAVLCRRHHRIKTFTDTGVHNDGRGGLTWTTPLGKTYHRPAQPVLDHPGLDHPGLDTPPF